MAVRLFTENAAELLAEIKRQIKAGDIETWSVDSMGDFTHITRGDQWENRAWLRPSPKANHLLLNVILPSEEKQRRAVYSVYQGRFIEMALRHVPKLFSAADASPFFTEQDKELNAS